MHYITVRNKDRLRYARPLRQEAKRFAAGNDEALTRHFATLENVIAENGVDPSRIWNLDDTGSTRCVHACT